MAEAKIHMPQVMKGMTISVVVTGWRRTAWRLALGIRIMRMAARVIGCDVEVSTSTTAEQVEYQPAVNITPSAGSDYATKADVMRAAEATRAATLAAVAERGRRGMPMA